MAIDRGSEPDRPESPAPKKRSSLQYGALLLIALGLALLVAGLFAFGVVRVGPSQLAGAVVQTPFPAPDFELTDQFAQPVRLSGQKGKVVVLTFLYTNCPDACPLIAAKLHQAYGDLGADASRTSILAVTVDPAHDTVAQVRAYSTSKDMLQRWHYLVGPEASVSPVWAAYGVSSTDLDTLDRAAQSTAVAGRLPTPTALPGKGLVDHAAPTFIIDRAGRARVLLDVDFAPADLVQDVRVLLAE